MRVKVLARLREDTNKIIDELREQCPRLQDAVNWADLRCTQAAWVQTDHEHKYYEVSVSEASPEASLFRAAIRERLIKAGWTGVNVVTEW